MDRRAKIPLRVYLDQADWSYLASGRFHEEELRLRDFANEGRVSFFLSFEHLVETAGLRTGLEERMDFLRKFPGIFFLDTTSDKILAHSAESLVSFAKKNRPNAPMPIKLRQLSLIPSEQISALLLKARLTRRLVLSGKSAETSSRKARPRKKKDQLKEEKMLAQFVHEDWESYRKYLINDVGINRFHLLIPRLLMAVSGALRRLFVDRFGVFSHSISRIDPIFLGSVFSYLPSEVRADSDLQKRCYEIWSNKKKRFLCAVSLACRESC